ncbi:MAG: hypothetical protein ACO225_13810 [Ilumatobacteraceae bacterium]
MTDGGDHPSAGDPRAARSNEERIKRIKRKADPWHRRVARWAILIGVVGAVVAGVVVGVRAVIDAQNRIDLPVAGPATAVIRSTTVDLTLVRTVGATVATTAVDGTVTVDPTSRAFEFVGRAGGPQDGVEVAGRLGIVSLVRSSETGTAWQPAPTGGPVATTVSEVVDAVHAVADALTVDEILTSEVRQRYVTLVAAENVEDDPIGPITAYELTIDTARLADEFPLRWQVFTTRAIPGAGEVSPLPVTVEITDEQVLTAVDAPDIGWSWRRLAWSADPFVPDALIPDQRTYTIRAACTADDGALFWQTTFATCDEALAVAAGVADQTGVRATLIDAGLPDDEIGPKLDLTVARLCTAVEDPTRLTTVEGWERTFGYALVDAAVCVGDPTVLVL